MWGCCLVGLFEHYQPLVHTEYGNSPSSQPNCGDTYLHRTVRWVARNPSSTTNHNIHYNSALTDSCVKLHCPCMPLFHQTVPAQHASIHLDLARLFVVSIAKKSTWYLVPWYPPMLKRYLFRWKHDVPGTKPSRAG